MEPTQSSTIIEDLKDERVPPALYWTIDQVAEWIEELGFPYYKVKLYTSLHWADWREGGMKAINRVCTLQIFKTRLFCCCKVRNMWYVLLKNLYKINVIFKVFLKKKSWFNVRNSSGNVYKEKTTDSIKNTLKF